MIGDATNFSIDTRVGGMDILVGIAAGMIIPTTISSRNSYSNEIVVVKTLMKSPQPWGFLFLSRQIIKELGLVYLLYHIMISKWYKKKSKHYK